jgi:hypothetical protein
MLGYARLSPAWTSGGAKSTPLELAEYSCDNSLALQGDPHTPSTHTSIVGKLL